MEPTPDPGAYDVENALKATRPKSKAPIIKEEPKKEVKEPEIRPEAGDYAPHSAFGDIK